MTAAINPLNVVRGPANIWIASFPATEPAQTQAALVQDPGAGWTFVGATQGGVTWSDQQTVADTDADQVPDPIAGRVIKRKTVVSFNMLEATVANLATALNNFGTVTVGTGITIYDPGDFDGGSIPAYTAVLVDGQAPQLTGGGRARRRVIFRKQLNNNAKVESAQDPTKDGVLAVTMQCYRVSNSLRPWVLMDQTA